MDSPKKRSLSSLPLPPPRLERRHTTVDRAGRERRAEGEGKVREARSGVDVDQWPSRRGKHLHSPLINCAKTCSSAGAKGRLVDFAFRTHARFACLALRRPIRIPRMHNAPCIIIITSLPASTHCSSRKLPPADRALELDCWSV